MKLTVNEKSILTSAASDFDGRASVILVTYKPTLGGRTRVVGINAQKQYDKLVSKGFLEFVIQRPFMGHAPSKTGYSVTKSVRTYHITAAGREAIQ